MGYSNFLISNIFLCDTEDDLPINHQSDDIAVIKDNLQIIYIVSPVSGEWEKITIKGEPGDITACWPIGSVFSCTVRENPAVLLGFGTWELLSEDPFYSWERTA